MIDFTEKKQYLQTYASCQVLLDHAGLPFHAGTTTTMRRNAKSLFTVVAEETPIDSKPRPNANRDVAKVNNPFHQHSKIRSRLWKLFILNYNAAFVSLVKCYWTMHGFCSKLVLNLRREEVLIDVEPKRRGKDLPLPQKDSTINITESIQLYPMCCTTIYLQIISNACARHKSIISGTTGSPCHISQW